MDPNDAPNLVNECKTIQEHCTYNADTHFIIASGLANEARLYKYVPIAGSVIAGALLAMGLQGWLGWVALASGVATAWATAKDVDRRAREHSEAGKKFTVLKHEARALHETFAPEMTREEFYRETRRLTERYNQINAASPQTTDKAFNKARAKIHSGIHTPDWVEQARAAQATQLGTTER